MTWFHKCFVCYDKTIDILHKNDKIIKILKELSKESDSAVDDFVILFMQEILNRKTPK